MGTVCNDHEHLIIVNNGGKAVVMLSTSLVSPSSPKLSEAAA